MSVAEICHRNVICVGKHRSIQEAARIMREQHVGSLVVVENEHEKYPLLGILTDRDIVVEVDAAGVSAETVTVADVMSDELLTVKMSDDVFRTVKLMRTHRIRRVPVVDESGRLVGILSVDDLIDAIAETLSDLAWLTMNEREQERELRP